jgi:hypothetical protein
MTCTIELPVEPIDTEHTTLPICPVMAAGDPICPMSGTTNCPTDAATQAKCSAC